MGELVAVVGPVGSGKVRCDSYVAKQIGLGPFQNTWAGPAVSSRGDIALPAKHSSPLRRPSNANPVPVPCQPCHRQSSLLLALLGEMPRASGTVRLAGRVAYAPQSPWILGDTVRGNILFGAALDEDRYAAVVRACALDVDIAGFPQGDDTPIGERGVTLSGGQRARLGLARALYADADVYLLDDPLSAVDTRVARILFENAIRGK